MKRILIIVGLMILLGTADGADACAIPQPFDPARTLQRMSVDVIIEASGIIVEGVVAPPAHITGDTDTATSLMTVDHVWKGNINREVVVRYSLRSSFCSRPPPFGTSIRFIAQVSENGEIYYNGGMFAVDLPRDHQGLNLALQGHAGMVEGLTP